MYGVDNLQSRSVELLEQVGLLTRRYDKVRTLSRGMQQRLSLARALLHKPPILLLDEPFSGLDVNAAEMVKLLLNKLIAEEKTVLLTVHDLYYALENSTRLLLLRQGKLLVDSPTKAMRHDKLRQLLIDS